MQGLQWPEGSQALHACLLMRKAANFREKGVEVSTMLAVDSPCMLNP